MIAVPRPTNAVRFGPFELDLNTCWLTRQGKEVGLAVQPARLLVLLVQRRGELVTRDELRAQLWPGDAFGDFGHGLNNTMNRLRTALGDVAATPRYIQTAPRRGYRFIAELEFVGPTPVEGAAAGSAEREFGSGMQANVARVGHQATPRVGTSVSASADSNSDRPTKVIAVSTLRNVSGDHSQDYLAETLTEALMTELASIRELRVFPDSVITRPRRAGKAITTSEGAVHLDMLVEGSVIRLANRMRIAIRVSQLPERVQIWSQDYDRELEGIFSLQKEVASAIAASVHANLDEGERRRSRSALAVKPEAFDCYLSGRFYAQHQNKADNQSAIATFERAVAIDPTFALAYAELAQAYVWKLFLFAPHERQWEEKAFVSVEKALSLDPDLAVAYLARGRLLWTPANRFPHVKAIREYRRAVALNPNLDEARNQLALIYCHIGHFEEALRESQEASLTNPNNNLAVYRTAQTFAFQGRHEQALALLQTIPQDVNPSLIGYQTAWVLFNLGRRGDASTLIEQLLKEYPEDDGALFISMQAVLAASAGDEAVAETKIEVAIRTGKGFGHFHHAAYHIAVAFALMNQLEPAVKWLDFAAADGFPCYPLFETDANLSNLRHHSSFVGFMARLRQEWDGHRAML